LREGTELITIYDEEELAVAGVDPALLRRPDYVRAKGELEGVESFDASFFGYSPRDAELLDPQQRLFLEAAWQALENAGYDPRDTGGRVGVFAGQSFNSYLMANLYPNPRIMAAAGLFQALLANDKDYLATRTSYKLGLTGPSVNVQTACSTSLVAVHMACRSLLDGECEMALAGGVSVTVPVKSGYLFQQGSIVSPDGHCRAFDADSRGTVPGNGLGIVVLKRLEDARRDGDTIRAVVLGSSVNNDGSDKVGFTAPSAKGQTRAITEALERAGVEARTIGLVEAHGTGTPLGDPIELSALREAFQGGEGCDGCRVAVGSVKSNLGHLDAAAGVTGLIKAVLALEHRELPPTLHVSRPNPDLGLDGGPFYINTEARDWPAGDAPRRAGVSSFGIGGTNAHVILEEAPAEVADRDERERRPDLLVLSARNEDELAAATANLAAHLREHPEVRLSDAAWTLAAGRHRFPHRRAVVCGDREVAITALEGDAPDRVFSRLEERVDRPVVFLFPGQGAQHVAMAAGLYRTEPGFRERLDRCAELLSPRLGLDLRHVLYPAGGNDTARQLERTRLAQPILFAVEYALAGLWGDWGVRPSAMFGHSVGELVAAAIAGVLELPDALSMVATRGRLVDALPAGAMLSVSLAEEELVPFLDDGLSLAAVNAPDLSVVSGDRAAIERLETRLERAGVVHRSLHTSHAFHSHHMEPAVEPFTEAVGRLRLRPPAVPFVSGATGTWITDEEAVSPEYWARHLRQPVRFADALRELAADPDRALIEVGPGTTLSTLARRQLGGGRETAIAATLPHPRDQTTDLDSVAAAVGKLWISGVRVGWETFCDPAGRRRIPLPVYPFSRRRYWVDAPGSTAAAVGAAAPATGETPEEETTLATYEGTSSLQDYSAPETEVEQAVAELWQELLGVERVGRNDHFFDLGGHSLMGVQLLARLGEQFPVELPTDLPFAHPSLASMAEKIEELVLDHLEQLSEADVADQIGSGSDAEREETP
jgi:acyl transferase domain-containing protein